MEPLRERIYRAVRQVPRGRVATYGDIAQMAGAPRSARQVGWALHALPEGSGVPWWRVVNRLGEISCPGHGGEMQADLLREEGVLPGSGGRIDLSSFRWDG